MRMASAAHADLSIPKHIAIIMDGNGRWAKERGLPRTEGHRRGADSVEIVTRSCGELGVEFLTLYAFSTENWKRPKTEVAALTCLAEIGGPTFVDTGSGPVVISVVSTGDVPCVSTSVNTRVDTAEVRAFLAPYLALR